VTAAEGAKRAAPRQSTDVEWHRCRQARARGSKRAAHRSESRERARGDTQKLAVCAGVGRPEQSGPMDMSRRCWSMTCRATARAGGVMVEGFCARYGYTVTSALTTPWRSLRAQEWPCRGRELARA
jgi:hypothetical protein